jgi:hypothetical protein
MWRLRSRIALPAGSVLCVQKTAYQGAPLPLSRQRDAHVRSNNGGQGPSMRRVMKIAVRMVAGVAVMLVIFGVAQKHFQNACYSKAVISSQAKAIETAKELIVRKRIFDFPGLGTSEDFLASLAENPKCCGASRYFSFTRLSSAWSVVLDSGREYVVLVEMDECGERIFDRGIVAE